MKDFMDIFKLILDNKITHEHIIGIVKIPELTEDEIEDELDDFKNYSLVSSFTESVLD
jgi:FAD/FMN-containing dehydrogenase